LLISMTGFGEARKQTGGMSIAVEVRTINSRHFKLSYRATDGYAALEPVGPPWQIAGAADFNHDGWADQARARRWGLRPRLTAVDAKGRSLFVTAGYGYDDRATARAAK